MALQPYQQATHLMHIQYNAPQATFQQGKVNLLIPQGNVIE
jgi:hypothetical protein